MTRFEAELREIEESDIEVVTAPESVGPKVVELYELVSDRVLYTEHFCSKHCPFLQDAEDACVLTGDALDEEEYGIEVMRSDACIEFFGGSWDY